MRWHSLVLSPNPVEPLVPLSSGFCSGGNVRAVFMNVNAPETRGTVFGILCIMDDVGKGMCVLREPVWDRYVACILLY